MNTSLTVYIAKILANDPSKLAALGFDATEIEERTVPLATGPVVHYVAAKRFERSAYGSRANAKAHAMSWIESKACGPKGGLKRGIDVLLDSDEHRIWEAR